MLNQVPLDRFLAGYRRHLLVRVGGAGATHELLDWLPAQDQRCGRRLDYSVEFPVNKCGPGCHQAAS
jgi:hypothetical protein